MTIRITRFACPAPTALISLCIIALLGCLGCQEKNTPGGKPPSAKKADTHESLATEANMLARAFSDTLTSAKDKASARAAAVKLDKIVTRFEQLADRMETIGDPQGALKEKVMLLFNEHEKIIARELPEVIRTILGNREIGEILEQAMENVRERMARLTVLDRWKAAVSPQVPVRESTGSAAPPAE